MVDGPIAWVNGFKYQGSWVISLLVSERLCSKRLKFGSSNSACMNSYAPQLVCQMVMSEPKVKGKHSMGAKRTYPNTILRDCGMQKEDHLVLWNAMHDELQEIFLSDM